MRLDFYLAIASLLKLAAAQTAPGFPISVHSNLVVSFADANVNPPGVLLPRADVLKEPSIWTPANATSGSTFVLFMIDQDVPRGGNRTTLLHWFQPNLVASSINLNVQSSISSVIGASYIPPTPPKDIPHHYTLILFPQPTNWTLPAAYASINPPMNTTARLGFDITDFVTANNLASPIAANYFRVLNGTAAETSSATQAISMTSMINTAMTSSTATMLSASASETSPSSATTVSSNSASPKMSTSSSPTPSQAEAIELQRSTTHFVLGLAMCLIGFW